MDGKKSMNWLLFSLMTVGFWGLYGVFLHKGAMGMADPEYGRYKAFLVVGIAYFLVAVLAPLILLKASGAGLTMTGIGTRCSTGLWSERITRCGDVDYLCRSPHRECHRGTQLTPSCGWDWRSPMAVLFRDRSCGNRWLPGDDL